LYNALDNAIKNSTNFLQQKKDRIESLTMELHKTSNLKYTVQDRIYNDLYKEYSSFNYDSAFMYSRHLLRNSYESKNNILINKARIKVGFILLSSGLFKETLDTLDNVSLKDLPDSLRRDYYALLSRTYFDMADYANDNYFSKLYNEIGYQKI